MQILSEQELALLFSSIRTIHNYKFFGTDFQTKFELLFIFSSPWDLLLLFLSPSLGNEPSLNHTITAHTCGSLASALSLPFLLLICLYIAGCNLNR